MQRVLEEGAVGDRRLRERHAGDARIDRRRVQHRHGEAAAADRVDASRVDVRAGRQHVDGANDVRRAHGDEAGPDDRGPPMERRQRSQQRRTRRRIRVGERAAQLEGQDHVAGAGERIEVAARLGGKLADPRIGEQDGRPPPVALGNRQQSPERQSLLHRERDDVEPIAGALDGAVYRQCGRWLARSNADGIGEERPRIGGRRAQPGRPLRDQVGHGLRLERRRHLAGLGAGQVLGVEPGVGLVARVATATAVAQPAQEEARDGLAPFPCHPVAALAHRPRDPIRGAVERVEALRLLVDRARALQRNHRSFKVVSANSASTSPAIQKRMMIFDSAQPNCSK